MSTEQQDPRTMPAGRELDALVAEAVEPRATLPALTAHQARLQKWGPEPAQWEWYSVAGVDSPLGWWTAEIGTDHGPTRADHQPVRWRPAREPSTDWSAAGPLLERHGLALIPSDDGWYCIKPEDIEHGHTRGTAEPRIAVIGREFDVFPVADEPCLAIARAVALLAPGGSHG